MTLGRIEKDKASENWQDIPRENHDNITSVIITDFQEFHSDTILFLSLSVHLIK